MTRESPLGKRVSYPTHYAPEQLFPIDRRENREACRVDDSFRGHDVWHAHEAAFITRTGLPVVGLLKIVYPASSPCIVESKSLKLYLHSLNATPLGNSVEEGIELFMRIVREDLEQLLRAPVAARFFQDAPRDLPFDFDDYLILERLPEVLQPLPNTPLPAGEIKVGSHLLRSNCKITGQPDWGSIFIHMEVNTLPSPLHLARYIISLRDEHHFHEEICEMVYQRLQNDYALRRLAVSCLYTRRGGIDICPSRASDPDALPRFLGNPNILTRPTFRQ